MALATINHKRRLNTMTKKDYILLARVFSERKPVNTDTTQAEFEARMRQWNSIIEKLEEELRRDNPLFNATKFEKACNA